MLEFVDLYAVHLYALCSLLTWLVFEMSGIMDKGREDVIDGTAPHAVIIMFAPVVPFIAIACLLGMAIAFGIYRASQIKLF